jgi:uncharacterized protein YdiU (UPF0061 family)
MNIGFKFNNTYAKLPDVMATKLNPVPVKSPKLTIFNDELAKEIGLDATNISTNDLAILFSGNKLPEGSEPLAQAYSGHQFGHFTMLGDGRAIVLGEHLTPKGKLLDIQFKGSGRTPYSRSGDGRAALKPMLREYLISEAMHHLNIPTTRSLCVVETGEIVQRELPLKGAILTRVASSHLRVGTFQYLRVKNDISSLSKLVDYTIERHYPELKDKENKALELFKAVLKKQTKLIADWMRVSFIHGVMNTDNMTISGETIDYGPCAFMDYYDPRTVFSSIDEQGRYAYGNQPYIAEWNLARFAEALIPLFHKEEKKAVDLAIEAVDQFKSIFKGEFTEMMKKKLGLISSNNDDEKLIKDLFEIMFKSKADHTNTFMYLTNGSVPQDNLLKDSKFLEWVKNWNLRIKTGQDINKAKDIMKQNNPVIIPRNHLVEDVLEKANEGDLKPFNDFLGLLNKPYEDLSDDKQKQPAPLNSEPYQTFCGT